MTDESNRARAQLFAGESEMKALVRSFNWSATPLGAIESWPPSLRTAASICLNSRFPMVLWWGKELVLLYNDSWRQILGRDKHPRALGSPGHEIWPEVWDIIGAQLNGVLATGEATWSDDLLLPTFRYGYLEEAYYTYSYSPIFTETGAVGGVFTAVAETTDRVLGARRTLTLRDLAAQTGEAKSIEQAYRMAIATLGENSFDIPFALLYRLNSDRTEAMLQEQTCNINPLPALPSIDLTAANPVWPLGAVLERQMAIEVDNLRQFGDWAAGALELPIERAIVLPLWASGQDELVGMLVAGVNPARELDLDYRNFFEMTAGHIETAIANAATYEAERQRAEALAELDRAKTAFFSNISHEFRTPLTLMLSPLEDLLAIESLPQRDTIKLVHRNGLRLLKLVNTLLDFSRIEAGRAQATYQPIDLAKLTQELASNFRSAIERAEMQLTIDCPPLDEPVYVDRDMWEKIVLNLLSNAFKFTFAGGITVRLQRVGKAIELTVQDTGVGIPAAELPRLFDRFHRVSGTRSRTYEGSGIGLALVQELVQLHGGAIAVTSQLDQGSTFTVSIPLGSAHLPPDRIQAESPAIGMGAAPFVEEALRWQGEEGFGIRDWELGNSQESPLTSYRRESRLFNPQSLTPHILLADDNADMRDYVQRLLSESYEVEAVADGAAALEAIDRQLPDLVLTDVMMPRLNGFGLLQALRSRPQTREIPIILLSARAGEEARVEGLEAGADDYLVKPFAARELLARVRSNLELARVRRASKQTLQENEARLRFALDAAGMVAYEWHEATDRVIQSANADRVLGLPAGTTITAGAQFLRLVHPDDRDRVMAEAQAAFAARSEFRCEFRLVCPDGVTRWMSDRGQTSIDADGTRRLLGVMIDISRRKAIEQQLRQNEQRLSLVLGTTGIRGWIWEIAPNRLYRLMPGATHDGFFGAIEDFYATLHPDDRSRVQAAFETSATTGVDYSAEYRAIENGKTVWLLGRGVILRDEAGKPTCLVGVTVDVSDRRSTEAALRESEARLRGFVDASVIGILFGDVEGNILDANDELLRIVGYSRGDLEAGQLRWLDITPPEYLPLDADRIAEAQLRGACTPYEKEYIRKDGTRVPVLVGYSLTGEQRQDSVAFILDLSDRKALEQQLRSQAEELARVNRMKDEFLAVLSHELRTPLNPILGWSQLLQRASIDPTTLRRGLDTIQRNARLQTQLIEDLLDVSSILQGKLNLEVDAIDLTKVVREAIETVQLAADAKHIALQFTPPPAPVWVSGDSRRLQQVAWNLLSNAVKFTPNGGRVEVRVESKTESKAGSLVPCALFTVIDTGTGIDPAFLPHVFDRFRQADSSTTRSHGGLGLGLAIVRHIAELHGGTVTARNRSDRSGAVFTVQLPLAIEDQQTPDSSVPASLSAASLAGAEILVVDDEADTRDLVTFVLEQAGAIVTAFSRATDALNAIAQRPFDLIVSDIGMPEMDGYQLMQQLRSLDCPLIPAIALTAYASQFDQQRAQQIGFAQHLAKPIDPDALVQAAASLVRSQIGQPAR